MRDHLRFIRLNKSCSKKFDFRPPSSTLTRRIRQLAEKAGFSY